MEALKSIKLFWKILLEKLFNLNISKTSNFSKDNCPNDSSREVARNWQQEMVRQALFVKSLMPCISSSSRKKYDASCTGSHIDNCAYITKPPCREGDCVDLAKKSSRVQFCHCEFLKYKDKECCCNLSKDENTAKHCRYVSVSVKTASVACNTCNYSVSITKLKSENVTQQTEMAKLMNENLLLKRELQKVCDEEKWTESSYCPTLLPVNENPRSLLHKFEESVYDTSKVAKDAESEMIITLRNCKNDVRPFKLSMIKLVRFYVEKIMTKVKIFLGLPTCVIAPSFAQNK